MKTTLKTVIAMFLLGVAAPAAMQPQCRPMN